MILPAFVIQTIGLAKKSTTVEGIKTNQNPYSWAFGEGQTADYSLDCLQQFNRAAHIGTWIKSKSNQFRLNISILIVS